MGPGDESYVVSEFGIVMPIGNAFKQWHADWLRREPTPFVASEPGTILSVDGNFVYPPLALVAY